MVFAASTAEGTLHIFDLRKDSLKPALVLDFAVDWKDASEQAKKPSNAKAASGIIPIADISFNTTKKDIIAASDWKGRISIWRLSPSFVTFKNDEIELFESLCKIDRSDRSSMLE